MPLFKKAGEGTKILPKIESIFCQYTTRGLARLLHLAKPFC